MQGAIGTISIILSILSCYGQFVSAWVQPPNPVVNNLACTSPLFAVAKSSAGKKAAPKGKYVPKWKKKGTLAEESGNIDSLGFENVGLKGTIKVSFQQGNVTKTSMAWAGQPIRDVATQAGQFIKYGCGKGECGTCECMVNGQWIRPCTATVPATAGAPGALPFVINVKEVKAKSTSSGTFFSIRSFLMGFWNNLLGMVGFVKFRRAARKNWEERQEYEALVRQKTLERKLARRAAHGYGGATP